MRFGSGIVSRFDTFLTRFISFGRSPGCGRERNPDDLCFLDCTCRSADLRGAGLRAFVATKQTIFLPLPERALDDLVDRSGTVHGGAGNRQIDTPG